VLRQSVVKKGRDQDPETDPERPFDIAHRSGSSYIKFVA
jgi:hypothetical protein